MIAAAVMSGLVHNPAATTIDGEQCQLLPERQRRSSRQARMLKLQCLSPMWINEAGLCERRNLTEAPRSR
jgi:hypothetical protein